MTATLIQPGDFFSPKDMMHRAEQYAYAKTHKPADKTITLAMMAGVFIGLAFVFYITITTGSQSSWGITRLLGGLGFSLGLILVVLCGAELFTSSTLSIIALANRQLSFGKMLRIWAQVYIGNFIGAILLLTLIVLAGLQTLDGGQWGLNALNIAQHKLHHTPIEAFSLGVLCNLLVCLAVWLTFSTNSALAKSVMMILPVAMFVSTGFEHCVANMLMVPLGIVIQHTASDGFWLQVGADPSQFSDLTVWHFLMANLIPVTLGNIVGGALLIGLANWAIYRVPQRKTVIQSVPTTHTANLTFKKEITMNTNTTIDNIMNKKPLTLSPDMSVVSAVDLLLVTQTPVAPVCQPDNELVGVFSVHDVMQNLWSQDYIPETNQCVADLMCRDVVTIDVSQRLLDLTEFFCIDKDQLYPTSSMGIATGMRSITVEDRLRDIKVHRPHLLPVMQKGQFIGTVSRLDAIKALRPIYGPESTSELDKTA